MGFTITVREGVSVGDDLNPAALVARGGYGLREDPAYEQQALIAGVERDDDVAKEASAHDVDYDVFASAENLANLGLDIDDLVDTAVAVITGLR